MGGMVKAIERGYPQAEIANSAKVTMITKPITANRFCLKRSR